MDKPCPFCGSANLDERNEPDHSHVLCLDCRASGPGCDNWRIAGDAWNRRAPDQALLALDARDRRALNALCSLGVAASTDAVFRKAASAALAAWACGGDAVAEIHKTLDDIGTTTAADPVTRLAGLGALVTKYHYGEGLARPFWLPVSGVRLDNMASLTRVTEGDSLAPGIAEAIARLLIPDAGEVAP